MEYLLEKHSNEIMKKYFEALFGMFHFMRCSCEGAWRDRHNSETLFGGGGGVGGSAEWPEMTK